MARGVAGQGSLRRGLVRSGMAWPGTGTRSAIQGPEVGLGTVWRGGVWFSLAGAREVQFKLGG